MKLIDAEIGRKYKIVSISGGFLSKGRLLRLGVTPNSIIELKRIAPLSGPLMIKVNGSDIVIGRGVAKKVIIEEYV